MNCAFCQTPLPDQSRFCMTCGADLSDPEVSTRTRAAVKEFFEAVKIAVQGHYRVIDMLGRGGMGAVLLAEDLRLGRTVAIKVLRPELASEAAFVGRFEREARIAARLDHPNIIPIYAVEEVEGVHYFVMKYVAGKSLDELLMGKPMPLEHCRQILWQAACGLGHAHQRGVVHRDVKPPNIMIDEAGHAIITDFGISKALQQDTQYTSTGQMIGTPRYISPEQAQGLELDGRSDQYSLAVVGYQMLVGRLPLIADSVHALMYKHIYEMPPSARSVRSDVPEAVSDALQRAMSKIPGERFGTMEEFATALWPERPVQAGEPTPAIARLSPLTALIRRQRGGHRRLAVLGTVAAALAVAFLLGRRSESPTAFEPETAAAPSRPLPRTTSPTPAGEPATRPPAPVPPADKPTTQPSASVRPGGDSTTRPPAAIPPSAASTLPAETTRTRSSDDSVRSGPATPHASDSLAPVPPRPKPRKAPRREVPKPAASAPASPAPPVPPVVVNGFITINAVPYGTVSIDGVEIGDTPIVRRALPPGPHMIRILRPGFRPDTVPVTITAGNEIRVSRSLLKEGT
jgi:serine/threonine-protein kinase